MHFTKTVLPSVPCRSTQLTADTPIYHRHLMMMPVQSQGLQDRDYSLFKARFAGNSSGIANSRTRTGNKVSPGHHACHASPCPHKPWMAKHPDRHVPTACLCLYAPVTRQRYRAYRDATAQPLPWRDSTAAACRQPVCGRWHARRQAAGLQSLACQAAACCHYGREMSGGRPGLQIEWSQNIKAVAPESVTAFESIMDGILTRGVTDLLRQTVPVKLPADVALRQCRVCSFRYQD